MPECSTTFFDYADEDKFLLELRKKSDSYERWLWNGFINYFDCDTGKRIAYEAIQDGYYVINDD